MNTPQENNVAFYTLIGLTLSFGVFLIGAYLYIILSAIVERPTFWMVLVPLTVVSALWCFYVAGHETVKIIKYIK